MGIFDEFFGAVDLASQQDPGPVGGGAIQGFNTGVGVGASLGPIGSAVGGIIGLAIGIKSGEATRDANRQQSQEQGLIAQEAARKEASIRANKLGIIQSESVRSTQKSNSSALAPLASAFQGIGTSNNNQKGSLTSGTF